MEKDIWRDALKIVLVCVLWYMCSTSDNIIGKVVLTDFPYPMTMTTVQLASVAVFLGPIVSYLQVPNVGEIDRRCYLTMILPLALGKFLSSISSFISIWKVSVSYAHTVKATLPLFTVLLSWMIMGERQTLSVYCSLLPIIGGVVIATLTEISFDYVGLFSALFATLCFSLQTIFTKKCLKDTGLHHLRLLVTISRISAIGVLPLWIIFDLRRIYHDEKFMQSGNVLWILLLLLVDGVFSMMHNVFAFTLLSMVSPLSYAVANATKRLVIISGSLLVLRNPVTAVNVVGMLVAVFGVLLYNKAKYDQNEVLRRQAILPYVHSDSALNKLGGHLPHSRSDANLLQNGLIPQNGHILLREWHNTDRVTIIPVSNQRSDEDNQRAATFQISSGSSGRDLHARSVHLV